MVNKRKWVRLWLVMSKFFSRGENQHLTLKNTSKDQIEVELVNLMMPHLQNNWGIFRGW